MDYNGFKKYFTPINMIPQIIGGFIVACGAIFAIVVRHFGLYFGVIIAIVGLCVLVFARDSRPSDEDVDGAVAKKINDIDSTARQGIDIRERLIKAFPPVLFADYDFSGWETDPENFAVQRGRDGRYRTNTYSAAEIMFAQERLHIYMYKVCLTEEKEESTTLSERYLDLKGAKIERRTRSFVMYSGKNEKRVELEFETIVIENNSGEVIFEMPVHDGADVDKTVETVNHLIDSKKNGTASFT